LKKKSTRLAVGWLEVIGRVASWSKGKRMKKKTRREGIAHGNAISCCSTRQLRENGGDRPSQKYDTRRGKPMASRSETAAARPKKNEELMVWMKDRPENGH